MELFQNLSTDLAEVVKSLFLFISLAAILLNVAELFEHFWERVIQETFLYNYFIIHPLVQEKLFKALAAILFNGAERYVEGHPRNLPVKLFQNQYSRFGGEVV